MNPPQQPQQAYQPQQHVQQQQAGQYWPPQQPATTPGEPGQPPHVSSKPMWMSKLIFRVLSAIFNIVLIGLAASVGVRWNQSRYASWGLGSLVIVIPVAGVCFIWDIAESICILARRGRRGIHPGAVVAIDLLLWLAWIVVAVFFSLYYFAGDFYYYDSYYYSSDDEPMTDIWSLVLMSRAVVAFVSIQVAVHILLFIFGCYETHVRNRRGPIIIYNPMQYPMAPPMGHPMSQYGPPQGQPIMLPAGQAPPAGYVPYAYGPQQPQPVHQQPEQSVSPETSTHGDATRNSYQPSQPSQAGPSGEQYPVTKQEHHHYA